MATILRTPPTDKLRLNKVVVRFRKELLPHPLTFFTAELGKVSRRDRKGWRRGNCPFHDSRSKTSFTFHESSGAWVCWGCDRRGDLISFVRLVHGCDFRSAAKILGAWDDAQLTMAERRRLDVAEAKRTHEREVAAAAREFERAQRIDARDHLHAVEALYGRSHCRARLAIDGGITSADS